MTRTTPPRPLDIMALFPELRAHSTTATRLHPRPGTPTAADSSVGGPLLWPADEAWPVCRDGDRHDAFQLQTIATVRRSRDIYAAVQARVDAGHPYTLTDEERSQLPDFDFSEPHHLMRQQIPLIPVAQLYRRDVPDFTGPDDTDLLQVLWCALDHPEEGYNPRVELFWRLSGEVGRLLTSPPEPPVVNDSYVPNTCTVTPERVQEYQYADLLPEQLQKRITSWENGSDESIPSYQSDLSLAPGWKVGGFANWSLSDPMPMNCAECGTALTLLFTADSGEWEGRDDSWRPAAEPPDASSDPTGVTIGRGYALFVFRCPASFDHPHATVMQ